MSSTSGSCSDSFTCSKVWNDLLPQLRFIVAFKHNPTFLRKAISHVAPTLLTLNFSAALFWVLMIWCVQGQGCA